MALPFLAVSASADMAKPTLHKTYGMCKELEKTNFFEPGTCAKINPNQNHNSQDPGADQLVYNNIGMMGFEALKRIEERSNLNEGPCTSEDHNVLNFLRSIENRQEQIENSNSDIRKRYSLKERRSHSLDKLKNKCH